MSQFLCFGISSPAFGRSPRRAAARRTPRWLLAATCAAITLVLCGGPTSAVDANYRLPSQRDVLAGPVEAQVLEVHDGDTIRVRARIWVGQEIVVNVRIAGIDAPELRGHCVAERRLARKARAYVAGAIGVRPVSLARIRNGKYAGRVLAEVRTAGGTDLAGALRRAGLARAYGGGRRAGWCG